MGLLYRVRQFGQALAAGPLPPAATQEIVGLLSESEQLLFQRFSFNDQRHSYRVMKTLREAGQSDPDLLAAALLHDIGKSKYALPIWARSLVVLAHAFFPGRATGWGRGEARGWRRPFVVKNQHAAWGAEMAEAAGSRPGTVALIGRHDEPLKEGDELLRLLQWADDEN